MLSVRDLTVAGRHSDLVPRTSFEARRGELLLVRADGQEHRTALALAAAGRLAPTDGTAAWGSHSGKPVRDLKGLRRVGAVVDAPAINEAELHLRVKDLVAEDLALLPRRHRGPATPDAWLTVNAFADIADSWAQDLPAARRTELLTALALANPETELLVLDSPDRHSDDPADWLPFLAGTAARAGRPLAVVAVVATFPEHWAGPAAVVGNSIRRLAEQGDLAATPGDLAATPGDLAATPGDLAATPGDLALGEGVRA
ncbi:ABC transporter ATP-binding protein [Sinomonas sp. P10A9]|uniref:ABC transporter ATP-binding protein n=1 Tax=Sinomonas puerhi TaxID=3238584 RepID=A0AB39L558_9MICC